MSYRTLNAALDGVIREEPCKGKDVALIALGLRALLSAIGTTPSYRQCRQIPVDGQVRSLLLDERLLEAARLRDRSRADAAWAILRSLADNADLPA